MRSRPILALLFILAGIAHFVITPVYAGIMPAYLPAPTLLVQVSGLAEILGGIGLFVPFARRAAAWGLILLLFCVIPANLNMALHASHWPSIPAWLLWLRLPLQIPLIGWVWLFARKVPKGSSA
jgi:uncharacterized membrane protein